MKNLSKSMAILVATVSCIAMGCENDASQTDTPEQSTTCIDDCNEGVLECDQNMILLCQKIENGCLAWTVQKRCEPGTHCDKSSLKCEEGCEETCDNAPEDKCNETGLIKCTTDEAGCAVWENAGQCPQGTTCDLKTSKCTATCSETCEKEYQCTQEGLDHCTSDNNGCAVHSVEVCQPGTVCDESKHACIECTETCDEDASVRCTDKGIESCTTDVNGCAIWSVTETCGDDQFCDEDSPTCMDGCKSECTPNEAKCVGNNIARCQDNGSGCFKWSAPTPCDTGKACHPENKTCEYTCGDDCAPFTIILIPDTQYYTLDKSEDNNIPKENNIYTKQMKWIKDNEKKENIRAAIHLGDITEGNEPRQWEIANYAHTTYLDKSTVPYTVSTGNHDYGWSYKGISRERSLIDSIFGKTSKRFENKSWYHASDYQGNSYITFSVGNIKFLVLALEFAARKDVVCWADELLSKPEYQDHHVIIEMHNYLTINPSTKLSTSVHGQHGYSSYANLPFAKHGCGGYDLYHELVARHSNVFLVVSGHEIESEWRQKTAFNGNTVTEMIVDYQFEKPCNESNANACIESCHAGENHETWMNAGNGWLRALVFDPQTNTVQGKSFTVLEDSAFAGNKPAFYCSEVSLERNNYSMDINGSDHQFTFDCDFTSPIDYKYSTGDYLGFTIRDINSNETGEQLNPAMAMHRQTGSIVAVWEDDSNDKDGTATVGDKKDQPNHDIAARIFYGGGCQKVAQFTVHTNTAGDQMTPAVAMDKDGNFVVVWADDKDGNGAYEILMRGFDEKGNERIQQTIVNSKSDGQQRNPSIAMAPDGQFVIAWEDESNKAGSPQIFIRGFDASGNQTFADRNVDKLEGVNHNPSVAMALDGTFVVAWDNTQNDNSQVFAKGFKADGTDRYDKLTVNSVNNGTQRNPSVGMNERSGFFYVTYEDDADQNKAYRIKAAGYNAEGKRQVADIFISDQGEDAVEPAMCIDQSDSAVFAWTARKLNNGDIRFRVLNNNLLAGTTRTAHRAVSNSNNHDAGVQDQPALGCTDNGKFVILWHDNEDHGTKGKDDDTNGFEILGHGYNEM